MGEDIRRRDGYPLFACMSGIGIRKFCYEKGISGEEIRGRKVTDSLLFCRMGKAVIIEHSVNTGQKG